MMTKLHRDLEYLGSMSRDELVERWQAAYGCPPPVGARQELLMYAAGWHIQAARHLRFGLQRYNHATIADQA